MARIIIDRDIEAAQSRRDDLVRRQALIHSYMVKEAEFEDASHQGTRALDLGELYDICGDQIGRMDYIIRFWEQNEREGVRG